MLRINYRHVGDAYSFSVVDFFNHPSGLKIFVDEGLEGFQGL